MHSYETEMQSSTDQHVNLSGSIAVPNSPMSLGLEGELSESNSMTQKAVGKKIVNRTVSFLANYKDKNDKSHSDKTRTFEEELSKYILEAIVHNNENCNISADFQKTPVTHLYEYVTKDFKKEKMYETYKYCKQFVNEFRITHYVNSISLGASSYYVLSEEEYVKKVGSSGSLGLEAVATSALKASRVNRWLKRSSMSHEIG